MKISFKLVRKWSISYIYVMMQKAYKHSQLKKGLWETVDTATPVPV